MKHLPLFVAAAALAASGLAAQEMRVSGPLSGYIYDAGSKSLRVILGFPGSAYLGSRVAERADLGSVSPDGRIVLVRREDKLLVNRDGSGEFSQLEGSILPANRAVWSADNASVILADTAGRAFQRITFGSDSIGISSARSFDGVEGRISSLLADGDRLVVGAEGGLYVIEANSEARRIREAGDVVSIELADRGRTLLYTDRKRSEVWEVTDYAGSAAAQLVADSRAGLDTPVGASISRDGKSLVVASAGTRRVDVFDRATRASLAQLDVDALPDRLERVGSGGALLLNGSRAKSEPIYLFDWSDAPRVSFVPAGEEQ